MTAQRITMTEAREMTDLAGSQDPLESGGSAEIAEPAHHASGTREPARNAAATSAPTHEPAEPHDTAATSHRGDDPAAAKPAPSQNTSFNANPGHAAARNHGATSDAAAVHASVSATGATRPAPGPDDLRWAEEMFEAWQRLLAEAKPLADVTLSRPSGGRR